MGMEGIRTAKCDYFLITKNSRMFVFSTMLTEMTFHQPRFSMMCINAEDSIKKDLSNLPTFFRHRTGSVRSIDSNLRVITARIRFELASKKPESVCHIEFQNVPEKYFCQELWKKFCEFFCIFFSYSIDAQMYLLISDQMYRVVGKYLCAPNLTDPHRKLPWSGRAPVRPGGRSPVG